MLFKYNNMYFRIVLNNNQLYLKYICFKMLGEILHIEMYHRRYVNVLHLKMYANSQNPF